MLTIQVSEGLTSLTDFKLRIIEIKNTRYSCLFFYESRKLWTAHTAQRLQAVQNLMQLGN